jgi:hypothetical protein
MGTIVEGAAKAKKEGTEAPWCADAKLIEGIKKCNLSPLSTLHGRMHKAQSLLPSITNHKAMRRQITKYGRSNHHLTLY